MMKSCKLMAFRFSERSVCFFFIIASIFHYGQSLSAEKAGVYIHEDAVIIYNSELKDEKTGRSKEISPKVEVTGTEYLYIKEGTVVSGIENIHVSKTKKSSSSRQQKVIAKREVSPRKVKKNNLSGPTQTITARPEQNSVYATSLSAQSVCVAPGSHYQNFILHYTAEYISRTRYNEYINQDYHYRYSVLLKNIIDGGGIRPPPFHC